MSLDLSDQRIQQLYHTILSRDSPIDWCSFGYEGTPNKLHCYASGSGGVDQLRDNVAEDEVQYGMIKIEGRIVLWTMIPEEIKGVKRARTLVHSRFLTNVFKSHHALYLGNSPSDFQLQYLRSALRLPSLPSSTLPSESQQAHSRSISHTYSQHSSSHSPPASTINDQSFVSAGSTIQHLAPKDSINKGKGKALEQDSPQFDLYHEYQVTPPHISRTSRSRNISPSDEEELDRRDSPPPPALPEKPPSPYLSQPSPALDHHDSDPLNDHTTQRSSLSPPPSVTPRQPQSQSQSQSQNPPHSRFSTETTTSLVSAHSREPATTASRPPNDRTLTTTQQGPPLALAPVAQSPSTSPQPAQISQFNQLSPPVSSVSARERPVSESPAALLMLDRGGGAGGGGDRGTIYHSTEGSLPEEDEAEDEDEDGILESYGSAENDQDQDQAEVENEEIRRERLRLEEVRLEQEQEVKRREYEEWERRRIEEEESERLRIERAEVEERRRIQEEEEEEEERLRFEEEERMRFERERQETLRAKEEMRLMVEREKLERKLREEEEARRVVAERERLREERKRDLGEKRESGQVMLSGEVSVQGAGSMLWRRRYYELRGTALSLSKSQADSAKPIDVLFSSSIKSIVPRPSEPLPPHSFKVVLNEDEEEWLFYTDNDEDKEMLIDGLKVAARL
ncbi:hypothetical protein JCM5353_003468 [Sporobolomyces roseus]